MYSVIFYNWLLSAVYDVKWTNTSIARPPARGACPPISLDPPLPSSPFLPFPFLSIPLPLPSLPFPFLPLEVGPHCLLTNRTLVTVWNGEWVLLLKLKLLVLSVYYSDAISCYNISCVIYKLLRNLPSRQYMYICDTILIIYKPNRYNI